MWVIGQRHYPLSNKYQNYTDHRPVLAEDSTRGFFGCRKLNDPNELIYFNFKEKAGNNYVLINNIPVEDRETIKQHLNYFAYQKNIKYVALIPTIAIYGALKKVTNFRKKYLYLFSFAFIYYQTNSKINKVLNAYASSFYTYYQEKYNHLAVPSLNQVSDKRRKFFTPNKDVYYRETAQEIFDKKNADQLHDGSIYYGPHPFNDHENVDEVMEINKKFLTGTSKYDHNETLLGDPIDIKRRVRTIPTPEEFRKI